MENGIVKKPDSQVSTTESALPAINPNRIVVFGSRLSGSQNLAEGFREFLKAKGVDKPVVTYIRNADNIEAGFFDYVAPIPDTIDDDPWSGWGPHYETLSTHPTLPRGVILLPEMRQYINGTGMFVPTSESGIARFIEKLCGQYDVPLVAIGLEDAPEQIEAMVQEQLLSIEGK